MGKGRGALVTSHKQKVFVRDLCHRIRDDVLRAIVMGKVPETYDGHELRVLLADMFAESASMSSIKEKPHSKRARDFRNWQLNMPIWSR